MTTNNLSYIQHPQHNLVENAQTLGGRDHELWSNGHLPGIDSAGPYPVVNHTFPPIRHTGTMENEDPAHVAIGLGQHRRNQSQHQLDADHPTSTPGITQYIPIDPRPPPLEHYAPAIPEVPNWPTGNIPLPHDVAGPSRGDMSQVHSGRIVTENLKKNLAGHYLYDPGSRVNDLRMRRSRSGTVKVLILLEIDNDI